MARDGPGLMVEVVVVGTDDCTCHEQSLLRDGAEPSGKPRAAVSSDVFRSSESIVFNS